MGVVIEICIKYPRAPLFQGIIPGTVGSEGDLR